jgi:hypothetical protein
MRNDAVRVVPAIVPSAIVRRLLRRESQPPVVHTADPYPVPPPHVIQVVPVQATPEQVAQLRAENAELRRRLDRLHADA